MRFTVFLVCVLYLAQADCLKLLLVFPIPSPSHYFLGNELGKELAKLGHNVTIVAAYKENNPPPNYKTIYLDGLAASKSENLQKINMFYRGVGSPFLTLYSLAGSTSDYIRESVFSNSEIQALIHSGEKFDIVIVEQFWNDAMKIFANIFEAHLILFISGGSNRWVNNLVSNPENPSYISDILLDYSSDMNCFQRLHNWMFGVIHDLILYQYFYPKQNALIQKYFPTAPPLNDILYNVSLVLTNGHESIFDAVPHVPNMVDIGGFHVSPPKKLPKDIQNFMDNATEGVIYFSLGSILIPSQMPKEKKEIILKALGARKEQVLWKWNEETLENKPSNVKISKWFPQQGILAHPNCKLFITHGGLLSTLEAIYFGKPVLALPVFGDQKFNAVRIISKGFGLATPFMEITETGFKEALDELLQNNTYAEAAKQNSKLLHDRPIKPIELADYWIRYVVNHNGASHLRVAGIKLPLYQYYMLDVFGVIVVVLVSGWLLVKKVVKLIFKRKIVATKTKKNN